MKNLQDRIWAIAAEILNGKDRIGSLLATHEPEKPAAKNPETKSSSQRIKIPNDNKTEKIGRVRLQ